ncbi:hypothetical protein DLD77_01630 [Chitinophaga alhagiae]|uniref:SMODS and SLOG-associating 2TM effector domain-containing protein n=1 Tax=Chitinophaga alhagiae TaxID=2203219 RepID=A0ABM6W9D6_9BACT|nr:hypothetical protein [Chitinophaga alhagiae]AWO00496.1 hypothetical protein DLD77_01630 [Chitinophaga alhagiae]
MASFYDFDYIIDINEKRLEQYSNAYQRNVDRFTNVMVIYSGFAIFLIPMVQSLFFAEAKYHLMYHLSFYCFIVLFSCSLINTIRLLAPVDVAYLQEPRIYYEEYRLKYENLKSKQQGLRLHEVDNLIKSSYIDELERAVSRNDILFQRKGLFYHKAFIWAIYAIIPYLVCLGFQLASKDGKPQKVEIVNNFSNFNKSE